MLNKLNKARRVAIIAAHPASVFELGVGLELFALARDIPHWYRGRVLALGAGAIEGPGGLSLLAEPFNGLQGFDDVLLPYWPTERRAPAALIAAIESAAARGGRVWSFCSGSFLLAQTSLLQGRPVTTHWRYREQMQRQFPGLDYRDDVLYHYDGRVGCSAGSAAAIDLGLEIVRRDFGREVAVAVARRLLASPQRRGGQSQFVQAPVPRHPDGLAPSLDWALARLEQPLTVDDMARQANMSRRSYDRKFRAGLNQSPKAWLIEQRLELARGLLEQPAGTALGVEALARAAGFENGASLRHHFRRQFGMGPAEYRRQYRQN